MSSPSSGLTNYTAPYWVRATRQNQSFANNGCILWFRSTLLMPASITTCLLTRTPFQHTSVLIALLLRLNCSARPSNTDLLSRDAPVWQPRKDWHNGVVDVRAVTPPTHWHSRKNYMIILKGHRFCPLSLGTSLDQARRGEWSLWLGCVAMKVRITFMELKLTSFALHQKL